MNRKIKTIDDLVSIISDLKSQGKKIVQCHGVFDLIHIGHIKHFEEAKSFGDILVVSITPDQFVNKGPGRPAFSTPLRLEFLAGIESIDYVVSSKWPSAEELLKTLKPNIYCKGPDYREHLDDITGKIDDEAIAIKSVGGEILYTDDITFSSSNLLNKFGNLFTKKQEFLIHNIVKKYKFDQINTILQDVKKLKVLVVGEAIIDQYVYCEALGKSGKEPVLVLRDLETENYLGGSIAIARHLNEFCDNISILSFLGEDKEYKDFIEETIEDNIELNFLTKSNSPTIIKRRFVDNIDRKKILGVYSINDSLLNKDDEQAFLDVLKIKSKDSDLVIVSDYGHGIITPKIATFLSELDNFVSLNTQVNAANIGTHNIKKYHNINSLIINATELQYEMRERNGDLQKLAIELKSAINSDFITVTQGKDGASLLNSKNILSQSPGFASKVVDKVGSGDALLALLSICLANGVDEELSLFIASVGAAQSVESIGNSMPVSKIGLLKTISHFMK
ncbi:PfkB family carbohydrate kinase [Candidatus Thioglobus sp.]|nr:PfkB family carbohydrate kinase [Candidatus Thioglobus sp.]